MGLNDRSAMSVTPMMTDPEGMLDPDHERNVSFSTAAH